ncbi:beta-grasp domain-containing protein, partial [Tanacetum coccineum]
MEEPITESEKLLLIETAWRRCCRFARGWFKGRLTMMLLRFSRGDGLRPDVPGKKIQLQDGFMEGENKRSRVGGQFMGDVVDLFDMFPVVRCCEDNNIVHVNGQVDSKSDIDVINLELAFSDLNHEVHTEERIEKFKKSKAMKLLLYEAGNYLVTIASKIDDILVRPDPYRELLQLRRFFKDDEKEHAEDNDMQNRLINYRATDPSSEDCDLEAKCSATFLTVTFASYLADLLIMFAAKGFDGRLQLNVHELDFRVVHKLLERNLNHGKTLSSVPPCGWKHSVEVLDDSL